MNISLASSRLNGFQKWSSDHPLSDNDDDDSSGGAKPIALEEPPSDPDAREDVPLRPWGIPGVGGAF
jgi:hypothetical protein